MHFKFPIPCPVHEHARTVELDNLIVVQVGESLDCRFAERNGQDEMSARLEKIERILECARDRRRDILDDFRGNHEVAGSRPLAGRLGNTQFGRPIVERVGVAEPLRERRGVARPI